MSEIIGTNGNNRLTGTSVDDRIYGLGGDDTITGLAGNDTIYGDGKAPVVSPGLQLVVEAAHQVIGLPEPFGNDTIRSGDGDDTVYGGNGIDLVYGGYGHDRLYGGAGSDVLGEVDAGNLLDGGDGQDTADFRNANAPLDIDLAAGTASLGGIANTLVSIESIFGTYSSTNRLLGDSHVNELAGGDLEDFMDGRGGRDILDGFDGNDTLYGGIGNDRLDGGAGNDRLYGQDGDDLINGGLGDDNIVDVVGNNSLYGGYGNDYIQGSGKLEGQAGDDDLYSFGATVMSGGEGHDHVHCGSGAQTVSYDELYEDDPSADAPIFSNEIVYDFQHGDGDRFDVSSIDANEIQSGNQAFNYVAAGAIDQVGEIGIRTLGGITYVLAEADGISGVDFQVQIASGSTIVASDIIL